MGKTKSKGMVGFVILVAVPVVFLVCFLLMYIAYVMGMTNAANTSEYVENVTHSTMLDFTMLNANYITNGTFPSTSRTCAGKTLLPIKEVMGIGLLDTPSDPNDDFALGYRGYEKNVYIGSCLSPVFSSLGFSLNIIQKVVSLSGLTTSYLWLAPALFIPKIGQAQVHVIYNANIYYNFPGIIVDIADHLAGYDACLLLRYLPFIGDFCDDPDTVMESVKTTYAYITLPNEEVATVITKTS